MSDHPLLRRARHRSVSGRGVIGGRGHAGLTHATAGPSCGHRAAPSGCPVVSTTATDLRCRVEAVADACLRRAMRAQLAADVLGDAHALDSGRQRWCWRSGVRSLRGAGERGHARRRGHSARNHTHVQLHDAQLLVPRPPGTASPPHGVYRCLRRRKNRIIEPVGAGGAVSCVITGHFDGGLRIGNYMTGNSAPNPLAIAAADYAACGASMATAGRCRGTASGSESHGATPGHCRRERC